MWKRSAVVSAVVAGVLITVAVTRADDKVNLKGIKCMICGMQVNTAASADYKGAKVFFGCGGCPATFQKNTAKYAAQANAQLVATGQARQKACPIMGKPVKKDLTAKVGGVNVAFCCPRCAKGLSKLTPEAQVQKVFNEDAFKKGFELVKHRHK